MFGLLISVGITVFFSVLFILAWKMTVKSELFCLLCRDTGWVKFHNKNICIKCSHPYKHSAMYIFMARKEIIRSEFAELNDLLDQIDETS